MGGSEGECNPIFSLHSSSSQFMVRLHSKNQLPGLPRSASKVCVGGGWLRVNLVIEFGYSLALAKTENCYFVFGVGLIFLVIL